MEEIIKEIAELIDCNDVVYLHKETHEFLSYPVPGEGGYGSDEFDYLMQEVMDVVDFAPDMYIRIDPLDSHASYQIMEAFVETVKDERLQGRLHGALTSRKPFRQFRDAVETAGVEEAWYAYRDAYLQMYVRDRIGEE
jgi:hypothetical protein